MAHALESIGPLIGVAGTLYGYLFENGQTGLPRGLYWNLRVQCEAITYHGETWEPAVLIDWLHLPTLRETDLRPVTQPLAEGSFYMRWHEPLTSWRLKFGHDTFGLPTRAHFELTCDYSGWNNDAKPNLKLGGSSPILVESISLHQENCAPRPSSHDEARAMVAPYFPQISQWQAKRGDEQQSTETECFNFSPP
jgi:hypothetical protein